MKKRILAAFLAATMVVGLAACGNSSSNDNSGTSGTGDTQGTAEVADTESTSSETVEPPTYEKSTTLVDVYDPVRSKTERTNVGDGEVGLAISDNVNPIVGYGDDGDYTYGGDPSVLVDGDTVYLYDGHDTSTNDAYVIPEYNCYSTTDLLNWTYEGAVFSMTDVSWTSDNTSAWASQVAKHYDPESGTYKYYLYFCSWTKTDSGYQSIGVAVSDSPTGPFVDIGEPLVTGTTTTDDTSTWNDIDPTVWIEADDEGVEHRYLAWGNGCYYICELNEDMISVTDRNGDGQITSGALGDDDDILNIQSGLNSYTEAPWLYRRQDEYGNYYGQYYLFYAYGWREKLAYATTDDLMEGEWTYGDVVQYATATSNTTHPAVFDFKGHTYLISHNGSIPGGSGYRRSPFIAEITFDEDGAVNYVKELAAGIGGIASTIALADGSAIGHAYFVNSTSDSSYPYTSVACGLYTDPDPDWDEDYEDEDLQWVLCAGKADVSNDAYVSIQSNNKPGLYLTANDDGSVTLAQESTVSEDMEAAQTFHTVVGLNDESGVSFESVSQPGLYLTIADSKLVLTDGSDAENATFFVSDVEY